MYSIVYERLVNLIKVIVRLLCTSRRALINLRTGESEAYQNCCCRGCRLSHCRTVTEYAW